MKLAILALLLAASLQAQIASLSTTDDGSILYFTTPSIQEGAAQPAHGKSFRIDAQGLALQEARTLEMVEAPVNRISNYYNISGIDVSGDGRISAIAASRLCRENICGSMVNTVTTVRGRGEPLDYAGPARLSQNGRYLAATITGIPRPTGARRSEWDLETGESWPLPYNSFAPSGRMITNDGTVLLKYDDDLQLFQRGALQRVTFQSETIEGAAIDAEGRSIIFTSRWPAPYNQYSRVRRLDLTSGELVTVLEGPADFSQPAVSNDASLILTVSGSQVFVLNADGTGVRQLTSETDGIQTAILSGNGRVAYALTFGGRLLRMEVEEPKVTEILGRTAHVETESLHGAIGSAMLIKGTALDEPDLQVTIGGRPAPILQAKPGELLVQVPWECAAAPETQVVLQTQAEYPLVEPQQFQAAVNTLYPDIYDVPRHADTQQPVTLDNPALPGESLYFYALGLGPVAAPVETGKPQPATPEPTLQNNLLCSWNTSDPSSRLEMPYAGLVPGQFGLYQVNLVMPARLPSTPDHLQRVVCEFKTDPNPQLLRFDLALQP
ncbi:hypothetical protein [Paludibaculum fermentans]|uniref:IPT/TIG domain-containing protein n=1 Tax=Paludibaculum fermentans TaxID=1473598 RepID=A0A7S7NSE6_PALFE|nr:hypothetical protein [Paludibaculum fermentans]QOY88819.1 hypothetical protein IRI77_02325 [Paludibaculum fermentans]